MLGLASWAMLPNAPPAIGVTDGDGGICEGWPNPPSPDPPVPGVGGGPPRPGGPPPDMPAASAWVGPPDGRPGGMPPLEAPPGMPPPGLPRPGMPEAMGEGAPSALPASKVAGLGATPGLLAAASPGLLAATGLGGPMWEAAVPPGPFAAGGLGNVPGVASAAVPGAVGNSPTARAEVVLGAPTPVRPSPPPAAVPGRAGLGISIPLPAFDPPAPPGSALRPAPDCSAVSASPNGKGNPRAGNWLLGSPVPKGKGRASVPLALLRNSSLVGSCDVG